MPDPTASCVSCDWTGTKSEGIWHDYSGLATDSMCDGQEGGMLECPECGEPCQLHEEES